jgi:hypothetical protein
MTTFIVNFLTVTNLLKLLSYLIGFLVDICWWLFKNTTYEILGICDCIQKKLSHFHPMLGNGIFWTNLITYLLLSTFVEFIILFAQGLSLTPLCPSDSLLLVSTNYSDIQESITQLKPEHFSELLTSLNFIRYSFYAFSSFNILTNKMH